MAMLCARDVMEKKVICLAPESSLREAWEIFSNNRISGAPVVTQSDGLVGVLSQSDILYYVTMQDDAHRPQHSYYIGDPFWDSEFFTGALDRLQNATVDDVMSSSVICVLPSDPVSTVSVLMRTNHVHRVIVTEENRVAGIITALDLLSVLERH